MLARHTVVQTFTSKEGAVCQLLQHVEGSTRWGIVVDGTITSTYDNYDEAQRAWKDMRAEKA